MELLDRLMEKRDEEYRAFQIRLIPNIPAETMIGVRTPDLRRIAKEFSACEEKEAFLKDLPHFYYEENLVHFFLIAMIRDFDACAAAVDAFLPYVNCWPVSDQSSPKVFRNNHEKLLPYIRKWLVSDHVYTARFAIRMLMNEFLDEDFREEYLEWVAEKQGEDYYLKMMIAWYFATALAKRYEESVIYLKEGRLDPWIHRKTIQKAIESYRVSEEHKEYLKSLRDVSSDISFCINDALKELQICHPWVSEKMFHPSYRYSVEKKDNKNVYVSTYRYEDGEEERAVFTDRDAFVKRIVSDNESWVEHNNPVKEVFPLSIPKEVDINGWTLERYEFRKHVLGGVSSMIQAGNRSSGGSREFFLPQSFFEGSFADFLKKYNGMVPVAFRLEEEYLKNSVGLKEFLGFQQ